MTDGTILGIAAAIILPVVLFLLVIQPLLRRCPTCGWFKTYPSGTTKASAIYIGPRLSVLAFGKDGGNKSRGMPKHPVQTAEGAAIDIPTGENLPLGTGGKLDYFWFRCGSLTGKKRFKAKLRVDLGTGAEVLGVPEVVSDARFRGWITPTFQRKWDDMTMAGKMEAYRWDHTNGNPDVGIELVEGIIDIDIPLDEGWTSVGSSTIENNPQGFKEAIDNAQCFGLVCGHNENGRGHGVRATGPARIVILSMELV